MAEVAPFPVGVPTVAPDARPPDDYQRINATPESFGAATARGLQQAGEGVLKASHFFGQVAADDANNNLTDIWTKRLYGDPNVTILGPDGKPQPDTGYMGLKGRSALDARPGLEKQMDDDLKQVRAGLTTPEQQLKFDEFSRRYRSLQTSKVGEHSERQFGVWAGEVNSAAGTLSLTHIGNNFDNPQEVAAGTADLIAARVKQAQIAGGGSELINQAMEGAKRDALKVQLEAMSVHDPARAARVLEKNREIAGPYYQPLAAQFRARATQADGIEEGAKAIIKARTDARVLPVGAQQQAPGSPPTSQTVHAAIIGQESGGNPNVSNSTDGAVGIGQIMPATFRQYARPGEEIGNPADNYAVSQRIINDYYQRYNGDAARVAVAYFSGPGNVSPAGSPTPWLADRADGNGKRVSGYVDDVLRRTVSGSIPGSPASTRAGAYQLVMTNPALSPEVQQHALTYINHTYTQAQIAAEADARGKKDASDAGSNEYVTAMMNNGTATPEMMTKIANDPRLTATDKERLTHFATNSFGFESTTQFGPQYTSAYQRIFLPPGDPNRIRTMGEILQMGAPGGGLSPRGTDRLMKVFSASIKNPDQASVNQAKISLINYAKSHLSFEQDTGFVKIRDPKGEQIFNAKFVPAYEAAFDKWVTDGKNPFEFLTQDNVDKVMAPFQRSKSEKAADQLAAIGEQPAGDAKNVPIPASPENIDQKAWSGVLKNPPLMATWMVATPQQYGQALALLIQSPADEKVKSSFNKWFGADGAMADDVLKKLGVGPKESAPAAAGIATPAATSAAPAPAPAAAVAPAQAVPSATGAYTSGPRSRMSEAEIERARTEEAESEARGTHATSAGLEALRSPEAPFQAEGVSVETRLGRLKEEEATIKDHLEQLKKRETGGLNVGYERRRSEARLRAIDEERDALRKKK